MKHSKHSLFPGKKKSGKAFKTIGGQRYKSREATGFNIPNKFQPKGTNGKKNTRRTKKG